MNRARVTDRDPHRLFRVESIQDEVADRLEHLPGRGDDVGVVVDQENRLRRRPRVRGRYGLSVVLESSELVDEVGLARQSMATVNELADGSAIEAVTAGSHDGFSLNRFRRSSDDSAWTSMKSARLIENVRTIRVCARRKDHVGLIVPMLLGRR